MAAATYEYIFTVVGETRFPIDMLRYDRCTPHREEDSRAIELSQRHVHRSAKIEVRTSKPKLTDSRWNSFGWIVHAPEKRRLA